MGNSTKPNQMPNQNNPAKKPNQNEKDFGNQQKEQVRPGQPNANPGSKNTGHK